MFSMNFWRSTSERAVKSFAQSLVALLGAGGLGLFNIDWATSLSTAAMAAVLSVLTSLASAGVGPRDDPSLVATTSSPQQSAETQPIAAATA